MIFGLLAILGKGITKIKSIKPVGGGHNKTKTESVFEIIIILRCKLCRWDEETKYSKWNSPARQNHISSCPIPDLMWDTWTYCLRSCSIAGDASSKTTFFWGLIRSVRLVSLCEQTFEVMRVWAYCEMLLTFDTTD